MSDYKAPTWYTETVEPFWKSILIVLAFLPWLLLIYWLAGKWLITLDKNDRDVIQGFVEWFGTAYSFFLALAIVNVWSQFETVERELDRELDAIASLLQTVRYTQTPGFWNTHLVKEFKEKVIEDIRNYIDHVIKNHKYECQVSDQRREGYKILQRIGMQISTLTRNRTVPEPFIYELFRSLNEATDVRGDRIAHSRPYAPVLVKVMAVVTSFIWLLSFLGLVIFDATVALILIGGVSFVIIMVLVIFFDLGEPFGGIWKINVEDWREFQEDMEHEGAPEMVFLYRRNNQLRHLVLAWFGVDPCPLSRLTHAGSRFRRTPWKTFLKRMHATRQAAPPNTVQYLECYADELERYGLTQSVSRAQLPLVLFRGAGEPFTLLTSAEIEDCPSLQAFEARFEQRIRQHIPWYDREIVRPAAAPGP